MIQSTSAQSPYSLPMGTIVAYLLPVANLANGWLLCDGSPIPDQYQELRTALGSDNTPNLAGMTLLGAGTPPSSSPCFPPNAKPFNLAEIGGEYQHTLVPNEMPSHTHNTNSAYGYDIYDQDGNDVHLICVRPGEGTDATGGDAPHNNMQPYYCVNYIIYAVSQ